MRVPLKTEKASRTILDYLKEMTCANPPEPFLCAGRIMRDLRMPKSLFYEAMGHLLGHEVGVIADGRRRSCSLIAMVAAYHASLGH